jgi:pimeloyl-ACP methyl ester carboxylesterase
MSRLICTALLAALLLIPSLTPPLAAQEAAYTPTWEETDCWFESEDFTCGYVTVPEDRANPGDGRLVRLAVAIYDSGNEDAPPLMVLSGGPGEKIAANAGQAGAIYASFFPDRDIILFDQRGAGLSEPALICPTYDLGAFTEESVGELLPYEEARAEATAQAIACGEELQALGFNLNAYSTSDDAADVNDIRLALDYDQVMLFGVSYGTRTAQTVMRDYPEGLAAVILDSVIPLEVDRAAETPEQVAAAFDRFFAACAADADCNATYPDLAAVFDEVIADLNAEPVPVTLNLPDGTPVEAFLNGDGLYGVAIQALYFRPLFEQLPKMIYDAREGEYNLAITLSQAALQVNEVINFQKFFATECQSEVAFSDTAALTAAYEAHPDLRPVMGTLGISGEDTADICAQAWGEGQAGDNDPVLSDIPTLILSGELDPVTPFIWGEQVAGNMSSSHFFTLSGVGHSVVSSSPCAIQIAQAFLADPLTEPAPDCLQAAEGINFLVPTAAVALVDYANEEGGFSTLVPEGWTEAQPGVFLRGGSATDQTALVFLPLPLSEDLETDLAALMDSFGVELPEAFEEAAYNGLDWQVYDIRTQGLGLYVAASLVDETLYVLIFQSLEGEFEDLLPLVGRPALEAFQVGE